MQYLDIVFFAIVAVVLGWKLYSVLGHRTGNERRSDPFARPDAKDAAQRRQTGRDEAEAPIQIGRRRPGVARPDADMQPEITAGPKDTSRNVPPRSTPGGESDGPGGITPRDRRLIEADIARAPEAVRDGIAAIAGADPAFDAPDFVGGARVAFDMIIQAFAAGDAKALQPLLAGNVHENFAAAIDERQRLGQRLKTVLIGVMQSPIVAAELKGKEARVTVKFVSEQISVTEDASGIVLAGDPAHVDTLIDIWTFARDTSARDPNWHLVATDTPQ